MSEAVAYRASPWGARYHATTGTIFEVLGAGAAGPGKTEVLLNDANDQIVVEHERCENRRHKHYHAWGESTGHALHLRRTRLMLEQSITRAGRAFRTMDPGVQWNEQKSTFTFTSGYKYQFGHCKDPNDWEGYASFEFSAIYFDELVQFLEEQYNQIKSRCRSSDPVLVNMLKVRSMSNPMMRKESGENFVIHNPHWVRDRFVKPHPEGNMVFKKKMIREDGTFEWRKWLYMPAKLHDNPNKEFVRNYEIELLSQPPHIRAALLKGDWFQTAGSFFGAYWNKSLHVCKPFKPSKDWLFWRSMDWGFKAPGSLHWWAMDEDGTVYCIKELVFKEKLDVEVAAIIKVIETDLGLWDPVRDESRITGVADTQLWEQRGDSGKNKAENMREKGVSWQRADKKSKQTNCGHLIKRLTDHDNGTKVPGIVFFNTCTEIISVLPSIQTSQQTSEEPMDGGNDHPLDSCLYSCAFASKGRDAIQRLRPLKEPWEDEDEAVHTGRRGRHGYG